MNPRVKNLGFTMVELLVSVGIFTLMTGVVLARYKTFGTNALFVNASEDVMLALRQAQVYGAGTKGSTVVCPPVTGTSFDCSYGVHFSANVPHGFISFVDSNDDGVYDAGEEIETKTWNNAISVTGIKCGLTTVDCSGSVANPTPMDITFKRPNPDAHINDLYNKDYKYGWITLVDANSGKTSTITISLAGQISVQ